MSEKDLELLITLDTPEEVDDDPHYQLDLGDTGIDSSKRGLIVEQNLKPFSSSFNQRQEDHSNE